MTTETMNVTYQDAAPAAPLMTANPYFGLLPVAETLTRIVHVLGQTWGVFLAITTTAYLLIVIFAWIGVVLAKALVGSAKAKEDSYEAASALQSIQELLVFDIVIEYAIFYAVMCIADGAIIRGVCELYVGKEPNLHQLVKVGLKRLGPLLAVTFLLAAVVYFPLICVVDMGSHFLAFLVLIFMVWASVVTYHVYPIIIVEHSGACASIPRSFELSAGHRCYVFTTLLLFGLIQAIPLLILGAMSGSDATPDGQPRRGLGVAIVMLLTFVVRVLFSCLRSILQAVLYLSVRSAKEGLNEEFLTRQLFGGAVPEAQALLV